MLGPGFVAGEGLKKTSSSDGMRLDERQIVNALIDPSCGRLTGYPSLYRVSQYSFG